MSLEAMLPITMNVYDVEEQDLEAGDWLEHRVPLYANVPCRKMDRGGTESPMHGSFYGAASHRIWCLPWFQGAALRILEHYVIVTSPGSSSPTGAGELYRIEGVFEDSKAGKTYLAIDVRRIRPAA